MILRLICLLLSVSALAVHITQDADRSVAVNAKTYAAAIGSNGTLLELKVGELPTLTGGFPVGDGLEAPVINVTGNLVAIRRGDARLEYTFGDDTIKLETAGYSFGFQYVPGSCKAVTAPNGKGGPVISRRTYPNSTGIVLINGLTLTYSQPFHFTQPERRDMVFSNYLNGSVKRNAEIQLTLKLGQAAEAVDMLSELQLRFPTAAYGPLHDNGNQGYGMVHFPQPTGNRVEVNQQNVSQQPFEALTYRLIVLDHYFEGKTVVDEERTLSLGAGEALDLGWELPALAPGFYWLTVSCSRGDLELTNTRQVFAVNLSNYRHPLTRPDDFAAFWQEKLTTMRAIPFNAELTEAESTATYTRYQLAIDGPSKERLQLGLTIPKAPGPYTAFWHGGDPAKDLCLDTGGRALLPEEATYRRWDSRDDNNLLQVILIVRRLTDYLVSRDDVKRIYLFGASRTGPVMFINAALDPTKICGVDIHVPTPVGMSWPDKHYRGWGGKPNALDWDAYLHMAAYVDAVNHAPNMTVPFIVAYGDVDNLAQPPGIEAMFQLAASSWKHISRDGGGHQRTGGFKVLQKALADYLQLSGASNADEGMMKEH